MRFISSILFTMTLGVGLLVGCNSNENLISQAQKAPSPQTEQTTPPPDNARRITAEELHKLWEKNQVLIIDTRGDAAFKDEHIKGAISVPVNAVAEKIDEFPRNKMIVAYCT